MSQENKSQWNVKDVALALLTNPQVQGEMIGEVSDDNLYDIFNISFLEGNKILFIEQHSDHKQLIIKKKKVLFKGLCSGFWNCTYINTQLWFSVKLF